MINLAYFVSALSLIFALVGWFLLYAVPRPLKNHKRLDEMNVSIIIPARNEAKRLPNLLKSIESSKKFVKEWIVVDDHSTDETATIARQFGARVLSGEPLPKGWLGKPWACYQGAQQAKGDTYIFLDADTMLHDDGLARILTTFAEHKTPLSIQPFHRVHKFFEQFSVIFNVIVLMTTGLFTPFKHRFKSQSFFGPCQILTAEDYWLIDGHASAKHAILEDIVFGKALLEKTGRSIRAISGKGAIEFRMYEAGVHELVQGWSKNFATGSTMIQPWMLGLVSVWITGLFIGIFSGLAPFMWLNSVYLMLYFSQGLMLYVLARKVGSFSWILVVIYPLYLFFFVWLFIRSSYMKKNKKVTWKGREIDL